MAQIFYNMIKKGKITIEDVPSKWKKTVQNLLEVN